VVAGFAAAALHGSKWVDDVRVVEVIHDNRRSPPGIQTHRDRIEEDEIDLVAGIPVTSPVRTVLDFGCWYPTMAAVAGIDSLARTIDIKAADVELLARRYAGRRGIARARQAVELFDSGAQSPKESWLRVVLLKAGLPRPQTQIPVFDELGNAIAYLDMGWEDIKVAVEYDGDHHRSDRRQYIWDIRRLEMLERLGWIVIRVVAGDRPADVVGRVRAALARRVCG
jgi:very-short-patch-repair endonuclease